MTIEDRAVDSTRAHAAKNAREYLESNGQVVDHPAVGHLILLYTTGRLSGQIRRTPLRYFEDAGGMLVAASYGGSSQQPDWYLNLVADPQVWVRHNADFYKAEAVALEGEERDRLWESVVVAEAPRFAEYQAQTDRVIPVIRLVPAGR